MIKVFQIDAGGLAVDPNQKILKSISLHGFEEIQSILNAAEVQALHRLKVAEQRCKDIEESAYRKGRERGRLEASELMLETERRRRIFIRKSANSIQKILLQTTKKIIGNQSSGYITSQIMEQALAKMAGSEKIHVKVPSELAQEITSQVERLCVQAAEGIEITVIGDPDLNGTVGCVLDSPMGSVDATLETLMSSISETFQDAVDDLFPVV